VGYREDIYDVVPKVQWEAVVGFREAKECLKELVILPARLPKRFTGHRRFTKSILLSGPPVSGKGYLAEALASEIPGHFFSLRVLDLADKDFAVIKRYGVHVFFERENMY
jgi:SpoVK/Ycf46/Vps4 family AAA+-type ATPase